MKRKVLIALLWVTAIALAGSVTYIFFASEGDHDWAYADSDVWIREGDLDNSSFYWYDHTEGVLTYLIKGSEGVVPPGILHFVNYTPPEGIFHSNYTMRLNTTQSENYGADKCMFKIQNKSGQLVEIPADGSQVILCYNCNTTENYYAGFKFYNEPGEINNCTVFVEASP